MYLPAFRAHKERVDTLLEDRDRLAMEVDVLRRHVDVRGLAPISRDSGDWSETKRLKGKLSAEHRATAAKSTLGLHMKSVEGHLERPVPELIRQQMEAEP